MWKYYISTNKPWWSLNDNNKPNLEIFKKWEQDNLVEIDYLFINTLDPYSISINSTYNNIQYLKIVDINDSTNTRYYYINSIELIDTNSYKYNMVVDIYTSYTLPLIYNNYNKLFTFLRVMNYQHKCLEYTDNILEEIPKIYTKYYFRKLLFNNSGEWWYNNYFGIKNCDVNVNRYYVFNDGVGGGYTFYPIMSKNSTPSITQKNYTQGSLINTYTFKNTLYNGELTRDIPQELNIALNDAYSSNKIIKWYASNVSKTFIFPSETIILNGYSEIKNVPFGIKPIDFNFNVDIGNSGGAGLKYINSQVFMLGQEIIYKSYSNLTVAAFDEIKKIPRDVNFKVEIYNVNTSGKVEKTLNNTIDKLEELRNTDEKANKFVGIFYLPHLLNFKKVNIDPNNYLYITIDPKGEYIEPYPIFEYLLSGIEDKLNNTSYSTPYLLKWLNIKYYGNNINTEYRLNYQNRVYITGLMLFTDSLNIVSKTDDLLSLNDSIISLPYQLPTGIDTYLNYVKANRNSTNTSFQLAKQEANIKFNQSIIGGVNNWINSGVSAVGSVLSGDIAGAASSAVSGITNWSNVAFDLQSQVFNMKKMINNIRAEYTDKRNTLGTQILFSTISDASLITYYNDSTSDQYEGVELLDLDPSILSIINNYLLLNGYFLPHNTSFNEAINNDRKFNFIQLDNTIINENINLNIPQLITNDILAIVKEMLVNGIRIWNIEDITIPNYNTDEEWILNKDNYTPQQPIPPTYDIINFNLFKNYDDYLNSVKLAGYDPIPYQVSPYVKNTPPSTYEDLFVSFTTFISISGNLIFTTNINNNEAIIKWNNKDYDNITIEDLFYDPDGTYSKCLTINNVLDNLTKDTIININWNYEIKDPNYCDTFITIKKFLQQTPNYNYSININDPNNYLLNYYEEFKTNNPDKQFIWVKDLTTGINTLTQLSINNNVVYTKGE